MEPNPRNTRYVMRPFFITGKRKEEGLKHLDNSIGYYSRRSKQLLGVGLAISTSLLVYKKMIKPMMQEPVE